MDNQAKQKWDEVEKTTLAAQRVLARFVLSEHCQELFKYIQSDQGARIVWRPVYGVRHYAESNRFAVALSVLFDVIYPQELGRGRFIEDMSLDADDEEFANLTGKLIDQIGELGDRLVDYKVERQREQERVQEGRRQKKNARAREKRLARCRKPTTVIPSADPSP